MLNHFLLELKNLIVSLILCRKSSAIDLNQDSDGCEKTEERDENATERCNSNATASESDEDPIEIEDEKEDKIMKHESLLHQGSLQMTAASYAAFFNAGNNKDSIETARSIIRVPAHRPQLPQVSLGTNSLPSCTASRGSIINSSSSDITSMSNPLLVTSGVSAHMGNLPTDFLPWSPYRPFPAAIPGYLPVQAGFLGPKFGGKLSHLVQIFVYLCIFV